MIKIKSNSKFSNNTLNNLLFIGTTDLTSAVGEGGDGQALASTTTADSTAINAYNDGGTMYFYSGDEIVSIQNPFIIKYDSYLKVV